METVSLPEESSIEKALLSTRWIKFRTEQVSIYIQQYNENYAQHENVYCVYYLHKSHAHYKYKLLYRINEGQCS